MCIKSRTTMTTRTVLYAIFASLTVCHAIADDDNDYIDTRRYWGGFGRDLAASINQQVREDLKPLDNLGPRINQRVWDNLKPLNNLGEQISQQVHEGLRPVREMESRFRIQFGNSGTTIATFKDRKFIVRNNVRYDCDGTISDEDGTCSGTLKKSTFDKKEDFCFASVHTIINNWYCLGNGNVNSGAINGKVYCSSPDDSPTVLISADEYRNLCGNGGKPVHYKYFTSKPMGEIGSDVKCLGTAPKIVCTMSETIRPGSVQVVTGGSSHIIIN